MRTGAALLAMLATLLPTAALAYDGLALGARAPGTAPVSLEGTDTDHARAVAELTTEMFDACRDGDGQACSTGTYRPGQIFTITADCLRGEIVDETGETFRHVGTWQAHEQDFPSDVGRAKFENARGRVEPTSNAFGGVALDVNYATLCPAATRRGAGPNESEASPPDGAAEMQAGFVDLSTLNGIPYDHNGSVVIVDNEKGLIVYAEPKRSLRGTVRPGTVLFHGRPWDRSTENVVITGLARVFKKGCEPADYQVRGLYSQSGGLQQFTLEGASPVRSRHSCRIEMHSINAKNASLRFDFYEPGS